MAGAAGVALVCGGHQQITASVEAVVDVSTQCPAFTSGVFVCLQWTGGSGARLGGDELPCLWLVLTAAVNSGLAISYVLAWRDQGFRAVEPSCKPGPDFEVCRQGQLLSSAGHLIWVVAAFAITGFACWFALSGRLNLAMVTLEQKIRSMRKSGKK